MHVEKTLVALSTISLGLTLLIGGYLASSGANADVVGTASSATASTATVNVETACSMTAIVNTEHNASLVNGIYSGSPSYYPNGIGQTTLKTFCNDADGYAIYAMGYTGESSGVASGRNTVLHNTSLSATYDIPTGTAESGDTSNWAMKVSPVSGPYQPTILSDSDGSFANFHKVPAAYTKVARFDHMTDSGEDATIGSSVTTTYAAYISGSQPAGSYVGKVKYTMVHPNNAAAPDSSYMQDVADWGNSILVGQEVATSDRRDGKQYTVSRICTNYSGDDCTQSQLWMTEDLDLDLSLVSTLTSENTNITTDYGSVAGYSTSGDVITWTPQVTTATIGALSTGNNQGVVSGWTNSTSSPEQASAGNYYTFDGRLFDSLAACTGYGLSEAECEHYKIGRYYNWSALIAANNSSQFTVEYTVPGNSICPKGWRLPNSGDASTPGDYFKMGYGQGIITSTITSPEVSATYTEDGWLKLNSLGREGTSIRQIRTGTINGSDLNGLGWYVYQYTSSVASHNAAYPVLLSTSDYKYLHVDRGRGSVARCISD